MLETVQEPGAHPDPGSEAPPEVSDPWRDLRRQQDRRRYLSILTPRRIAKEKPRRPSPANGVPRSGHHLLLPPARLTRTATNFPDPEQVRQYLRHSADLTVHGSLATAVVYPLAVCTLAEHYVFRRVAGSSAGAVVAAAVAAAELGRGAPDAASDRPPMSVDPGFAGLAQAVGWLAGQDVARQDSASLAQRSQGPVAEVSPKGKHGNPERPPAGIVPGVPGGPEQWRLARLFRPARDTRVVFRILVAALRARATDNRRSGDGHVRRGGVPLLATVLGSAMVGAAGRLSRGVTLLLWLGGLLAWLGITATLVSAPTNRLLAAAASVVVLVTFGVCGLVGTLLSLVIGLRTLLERDAEPNHFGLVAGVSVPGEQPARGMAARLDRLAGVPDAGDLPPLMDWLTDRIDDLAGVAVAPVGADRQTLTFGDLWLGRVGPRSSQDIDELHLAATDPQLRTIDLTVMTSNVSQGRPYRLPLRTAEQVEAESASRFLFCRTCLDGVLPARVVEQMVYSSPALEPEQTCPRHRGEALHEVPDPWDFPVIAAVRLGMSVPGLLRAVPLVTVDEVRPGALSDPYGRTVSDEPSGEGAEPRRVARVHWFCDSGATAPVGVSFYDTLLPRWPTFGLTLDRLPSGRPLGSQIGLDDGVAEWCDLPPQDSSRRRPPWRAVPSSPGFLRAVLDASLGWRDVVQAQLPGMRGRTAWIRTSEAEAGNSIFLTQAQILQLALRGYHAGLALRERFTGPDGEVTGQTQTDRYRWIRLRAALREYRHLSMSISARLPLYSDLAAGYRIPEALTGWFSRPVKPGTVDPSWADAGATITHLRALSAGGVLDWDTEYGAPPVSPELRGLPPQ